MAWMVIGAGAIGGGIGGALARTGEHVQFIARGQRLEALRAGLHWQTPDLDEVLVIPASAELPGTPHSADVLCIATKLHDAEAALTALPDAWRDVPVVCWTNGTQAPRWANNAHRAVLACAVNVPASIESPNIARLWGVPHYGAMHVGVLHGDGGAVETRLVHALARAGFDAYRHDDVLPLLHAKWMTNLMGAAQVLCLPEHFEPVALAALEEGRRVLTEVGWPLAPTEALSPREMTLGLIHGEARGGGSSWQSLKQGRPLETPYLNRPLVALAQAHRIDTPVNDALLRWIDVAVAERWTAPRLHAAQVFKG